MTRATRKAVQCRLRELKRWGRVERAIVRQLVRVPRGIRGQIVSRAMEATSDFDRVERKS